MDDEMSDWDGYYPDDDGDSMDEGPGDWLTDLTLLPA